MYTGAKRHILGETGRTALQRSRFRYEGLQESDVAGRGVGMENTVHLKKVWEDAGVWVLAFAVEENSCRLVYQNGDTVAGCPVWQGDFFDILEHAGEADALRQAIIGKDSWEAPLFCHIRDRVYSAIPFNQSGLRICIMQDTTAYQRENQRRMDEAVMANRAKTSFLSEISHDIRTPMNAIVGMTEIAMMQERVPKRIADCLDKIKTASDHMMSLLNEVLDMSRIESGKVVLQPEEIDLADLLHEILIVVKAQADGACVDFGLEIGKMERENVWVDGVRLKQICLNLLSNAVKFTPKGGSVGMFWEVLKDKDPDFVELYVRVQDTGMGMSEQFLSRIFTPFEREQNTTISKIQGTGLGMAITKNLTEMMGGRIAVQSKQGEGTCFEIWIPLKAGEECEDVRKVALRHKRVLVLDGDCTRADNLAQMLEGFGMEADLARDVGQAADFMNGAMFAEWDYFAFLTVEKVEGVEMVLFLQEIRSRFGNGLPIVLLSESDWSQIEYLFTSSGVDAFVPLPLFANRLLAELYGFTEEGKEEKKMAQGQGDCDFCGRKILLVEDNEINREIAVELLGVYGMDIETAENGMEAVEFFERSAPFSLDMILMDVQMPVLDGLGATQAIRRLDRPDAQTVPIVAMTANAFMEDIQRSLDAGMNGHLSKPLDLDQMRDCLKRFLGRESA